VEKKKKNRKRPSWWSWRRVFFNFHFKPRKTSPRMGSCKKEMRLSIPGSFSLRNRFKMESSDGLNIICSISYRGHFTMYCGRAWNRSKTTSSSQKSSALTSRHALSGETSKSFRGYPDCLTDLFIHNCFFLEKSGDREKKRKEKRKKRKNR